MNSEEACDLQRMENDGIYRVVIVRRDPCVDRVEARLNNGLTWTTEQGHDDFALIAWKFRRLLFPVGRGSIEL